MLKATGGGGGIGMQVCQSEKELKTAYETCQMQAEKYFGNSGVYLEKYYPKSRHIEVQIFGDGRGHVIHLGERECSVQRRNQKVIEETPSPFIALHPELREKICAAAVSLAESIKYRSAGTVEFLVVDEGPDSTNTGKYYFLEMNTRLQVEHGVTELVNSVDLVEWMILQGNAQKQGKGGLDLSQFHWLPSGHAIEARLYAENPMKNFQPSPGLLTEVSWPNTADIRVDTWVQTGTRVSSLYDPLIAKIMVHGKNRQEAIANMTETLNRCHVKGPCTNLEYLQDILKFPDFISGQTLTSLLSKLEYCPKAIEVIQGGMETTVQDWPGRMGLRVFGIQPSGPLDDLAFRVANIMVGNDQGTSALEITMKGPQLMFHVGRLIALTGTPMEITVKYPNTSEIQTKPMWSRFYIPPGSMVTIGKAPKGSAGCRSYMAVYGGLDIPDYLGSKSTFPAFGYGGFQGRALKAGDMLPLPGIDPEFDTRTTDLHLPRDLIPMYQHKWQVCVMPGPQADPDYVKPEGMDDFFTTHWKVHHNSNRMGIRLVGPTPNWTRNDGGEGGSHPSNIHDNPYALGSINFTGDSPVVLTTEGPTQGGFVCPWTIITSELWKLGQVMPGDTIRFYPVSLTEALGLRSSLTAYLAHIQTIATHHPIHVPGPVTPYKNIETNIADISKLGKAHHGVAILKELKQDDGCNRPFTQYRQAGECYVLVEYGDSVAPLDLNMRARIHVLQDTLRLFTDTKFQRPAKPLILGTLDAAPCLRSLLIRYDPDIIPQSTLLAYLIDLESKMPDCTKMVFPSREIHMPFAFDDQWCKEATEKYIQLVRKEASYLPSNVEFIAQNNGLKGGKQEVCQKVAGSPWLVVGVGFFLGCPFMVPVDPLKRLNVPKYNPARTYTAAGTVGLGGSFTAIYPLESPGGYQMYGRTIPTWDSFGIMPPFSPDQPWLLNMFDQVTFDLVTEDELLECRRLALSGKYKYNITDTIFDMSKQNENAAKRAKEIREMHQRQKEASDKMRAIEATLLKKQAASQPIVVDADNTINDLPLGHETTEAAMVGVVKSVLVKVGDAVTSGETPLCTLEAMKSEMTVNADKTGKIVRVNIQSMQQVSADTVVCVIDTKCA